MSEVVLKVAAKGVIVNAKGEILILREAKTYKDGTNVGKYHMPGGRLESGESYSDGLNREIFEETGLRVKATFPIYVGEWSPVIRDVPHHIIAIFTVCETKDMKVRLSDEHDDYKWIDPKNYKKYNIMAPEDAVFERYNAWQHK